MYCLYLNNIKQYFIENNVAFDAIINVAGIHKMASLVESDNDVTKGWTEKTTIVKVKYGNSEKQLKKPILRALKLAFPICKKKKIQKGAPFCISMLSISSFSFPFELLYNLYK